MRDRAVLVSISLAVMVGSAAPLLAAAEDFGLRSAAISGDVRSLPAAFTGAAGALALVLAVTGWRRRMSPECFALLAASSILFAWGFLLAAIVGVAPTSYYPAKVHWSAVMISLPVIGAGVVAALSWLDGQTRPWRVALVPCAVVVALVTMLGAAGPWLALLGRWSTADGARAVAIATSPGAGDASAVWTSGSEVDDRTARALLDFYRVDVEDGIPPFISTNLAQDCADLGSSSRPTVLSDRDPDDVRKRYSCASGIVVTPVRARDE